MTHSRAVSIKKVINCFRKRHKHSWPEAIHCGNEFVKNCGTRQCFCFYSPRRDSHRSYGEHHRAKKCVHPTARCLLPILDLRSTINWFNNSGCDSTPKKGHHTRQAEAETLASTQVLAHCGFSFQSTQKPSIHLIDFCTACDHPEAIILKCWFIVTWRPPRLALNENRFYEGSAWSYRS